MSHREVMDGADGADGVGVPTGGSTGEVLTKNSATDFDTSWQPPSGGVTTTGTPASGNLAEFSGASTITNGDLSGDVTTAGTLAATIANGAVTLAKIADASANSKLVGSGDSGSGSAYSEISLGTNLSMSGTTLNASGSGGGGLLSVQYPPLKPVAPLDDFTAASLDGRYSAHSSQGSFATTDCITQARDGSALRMAFDEKMGCLYWSHTNTDLDMKVGAMRPFGWLDGATAAMFGIAALNSSGTGVGMVVYNDNNAYLANITAWNYASLLQAVTNVGHNRHPGSEYWLRLVRATNTWTGYVSLGGSGWGTATSTSSVTITVDRVAIGMFYDTAAAHKGALEVDWIDVT